jgi:energy-coupling factor transport system ATP-binding protein
VDPALEGVSFTVEPGELVVLMGASGSGKSTLLAAMAGTLPTGGESGSLEVEAVGSGGPLPRVGLVQQEPEGNIVMQRIGDDVAFPLENAAVPPAEIWRRVDESVAGVGLAVDQSRDTALLSGGQQQLLAVAAASVVRPDLLLLDEPTANLDPRAAAEVLAAVDRARVDHGGTIVVVEHRVEAWLQRADRVLLVEGSGVVALAPDEVTAYLGARPESASRVWVDHAHLTLRPPISEPGAVVLRAHGLSCPGRLPPTDLVAHAGEVVAVTGPPGSGKSTLLACLAGLLTPTAGTLELPGTDRADPWTWSSRDVASTFGVVFQNPEHQFVTGAVIDEVHHGLRGMGITEAQAVARADRMLARLHLTHLARADPFTLSGGEQRRLSVGSALALDPGILVLDEPTFGQDPATWDEIVEVIAAHRDAGGAVVMATHDPDLVRVLSARPVQLAAAADRRRPTDGPPPARENRLRRLDPLALMAAAMTVGVAALLSGSVALNLGLAALAVVVALTGGLPRARVALLATPALVASASVAFSNALLSSTGITDPASWSAAALPASRVLAVALPGLVAAVAIDPTGLADSLVARLGVPARAAYSVLAGLRLLPLLSDEWAVLGRASRARGLGGSGLGTRARQFVSMTFRLLVAALRRGGRLAVALDARGLRSGTPRTVARPIRWSWADPAAILLAVGFLVLAVSTRLS